MDEKDARRMSIQSNWLAAQAGAAPLSVVEFPLYSDARFIGEVRQEGWPYSCLNTIPLSVEPGRVQVPVVARIAIHTQLFQRHVYGSPSSSELYHGGWIPDEVAALASLALGKRFMAGDEARRFDGSDELGTPRSPRRRGEPTLLMNREGPMLPDVATQGDLRDLIPRFSTVPALAREDCIELVRAARLYQDALWVAESEPNLAWLLLVSAVETAANRWKRSWGTSVANLHAAMPDLAKRVQEVGGDDLMEFVAKKLSHLVRSTEKFVAFVVEHLPEPPAVRPESPGYQVEWTASNMASVLRIVYGYRSEALHGGTPFPAPMCLPASRVDADGPLVEVGTEALAVTTEGGYWIAKDLPINLPTFHYLARGALLRWWDSLASRTELGKLASA
jgi:hypothetical protein